MYNIEKKQVQAQIQAYGEFTKRKKGEEKEMTTSYRPCHSKYQTKPEPTLQLKVWEDKVLAKNMYQ